MSKTICIYCKKEKNESEFNREHVVPRMLGTYENGFVLSNNEVCKECNSYFSRELENKLSLNSYESLLRMEHGKPMSDGRRIKNERLTLTGAEGILKGLKFTPVVDSNNAEGMHFDISPRIGILSSEVCGEYDYYEIGKLPQATEEKNNFLKGKENAILLVRIPQTEAESYLLDKGYLSEGYKSLDDLVRELYPNPNDSFRTQISYFIDSIVRRTCAKTAINYLCYCKGKDYILSDKFDAIREYIRYGKWSDDLWFRYSIGPVKGAMMPNDTAHVIGYMLYKEGENWILCGCLTWYGKTTYIFKLGVVGIKTMHYYKLGTMEIKNWNIDLPYTKMAYFDNVNRRITEEEAMHLFATT